MTIDTHWKSDQAILSEVGDRLQTWRLHRNLSQDALAREAGVSKRTIERLESGHSVQATNLIRVLRSLELLENLDLLIPEPLPSPIQALKLRGKQRQRASRNTSPRA